MVILLMTGLFILEKNRKLMYIIMEFRKILNGLWMENLKR